MNKFLFRLSLFTILFILLFFAAAFAAKDDTSHLFCSWEGFEPDKCASIWLIKKFVDKEAMFVFVQKGEFIEKGIAFDTPDAELRRYATMSTFESIIKKYDIKDKIVSKIGDIMHDIEINTWQKKKYDLSKEVIENTLSIIKNSKTNDEIISRSINYFDELYMKLTAL
ncbi:MAG: chromate resistance protein ChrB domain-containing protein [bacterium]